MSVQTSTKIQFNVEHWIARSFFYRLLSQIFSHPDTIDRAFLDQACKSWPKMLARLEVREKSHFENILGKFFHELSQVTSQKWIDLYESSFGHTAHAKVPAYEIEYGEEHSHRQPQELSDIASFYNAFGLKASDRLRERVDHVSVECEFMFFLLYKTAYALACDGEEKAAVCEQACRAFLSNHLSRWLPAFARRLARMTDHALMRSVAELATAWMSEECRLLEIKIGDEELGIRPVQEKEEAGCVSCLEATRKVPDQGGCHGA